MAAVILSPLDCRVGVPLATLRAPKGNPQQHIRPGPVKAAASSPSSTNLGGSSSWGGAKRVSRGCIGKPLSRTGLSRRPAPGLVVSSSAGDAAAGSPTSSEDSSPAAASGGAGGSPNVIAQFVRGLRLRMAADANFPFKLGAEVCLDEVMTVAVNIGVRGNPVEWLLGAKLQVICQMLTAAVNDVILVYCLAPVKQEAGEGGAGGAAPKKAEIAHIFQEGDFSAGERLRCYVSKGGFYALIGAFSCTLSMALALTLSGQTAQLTPQYLFRALLTGGLHMGISANTRYQIVNGIERVLYSILSQSAARTASVVARLLNNLLGARLWIVMTTLTGLA
mmetsp:Transcript_28459/g.71305  ORF Transcript_28459/g.71305 Transcript_28459/m.71305 type:complete len:335 (-) Transcript_28459:222-1226(-)|eukprot:CAMPEP_0181367000 /NCGR_PEP_ID=MMETSP1106-20121128/11074_1 /TAXON_ID=81844 /ORGANISM="Mantoniella antarctica, Strain SL-175" /LENGTH=334 /DNA_ID=CAMNT_0023482527 /DNA_START=181 /DNA_END=1185 /DNA_ORIENTATION=+